MKPNKLLLMVAAVLVFILFPIIIVSRMILSGLHVCVSHSSRGRGVITRQHSFTRPSLLAVSIYFVNYYFVSLSTYVNVHFLTLFLWHAFEQTYYGDSSKKHIRVVHCIIGLIIDLLMLL